MTSASTCTASISARAAGPSFSIMGHGTASFEATSIPAAWATQWKGVSQQRSRVVR